MLERIDLHTHSLASDGTLAPAAVIRLALERGVELLALTDHDTTAGLAEARAAAAGTSLRFLDGIELTADWRGREIHVVGLKVNPEDEALQQHVAGVYQLRRARLLAMGEKLTQHGLPGAALAAAALAGGSSPTRQHLSRALIAAGHAADNEAVFTRWLGRKGAAYVPAAWPELATVVARIVAAGGHAVLAHPHRYQCSAGQLRELCASFKAAGGTAIEVSLAGMGQGDAIRCAALARRFDLAASVGSDFHEPGLPWRPLGRAAKLPEGLRPLSAAL